MVKIINPYNANGADGIGASLAQLGQVMFGDTLGNDMRRAKLTGMEMENQGRRGMADLLGGGNPNWNEYARNAALSGDKNAFDYVRGMNAMVYGATDPRTTNAMVASGMGYNTTAPAFYTTQDVEIQKAQMAADRAAAATAAGIQRQISADDARFRLQQDRQQWEWNNSFENILDSTSPTGYRTIKRSEFNPATMRLAPTLDTAKAVQFANNFGKASELEPEQQKALGFFVEPDKVQNWIDPVAKTQGRTVDGKTDLGTGKPLSNGAQIVSPSNSGGNAAFTDPAKPGQAITKNLQEATMNSKTAEGLIGSMIGMVEKDSTIVGPAGNLKRIAQDGLDVFSQFTGGDYQSAVASARDNLMATGGSQAAALLPGLFNSDLNSIETLNAFLVYKAAAALGQDGRSASNADIERIQKLVGNPSSWVEGSATYLNKMRTLQKILQASRANDEKILNSQNVNAGGVPNYNVGAGGASPAATSGGATPSASGSDLFSKYGLVPPGAR